MPDDHAPRDRQPDDTRHDAPPPIPTARRRPMVIAGLVAAAILLVILVLGTLSRLAAHRHLQQTATADATPTVSVVHPTRPGGSQLVLPARLDPWEQAPIHAQVSGYLRRWYCDIGTPVAAGTVLADIDTPAADQQLAAARAALQTASAQQSLAATTSRRFSLLAAQNAASQQDADTRRGNYAATASQRNEALAEVGRLQALVGFKQLVAPFAGVVTARNTDIGQLVTTDQGGSQPLFVVSDLTRLRLYVSVPQADVAQIVPGLPAHFSVPDYPGRVFTATVARTANAVDPQSGAMLVQLVYDNAAGLLKAGDYAEVTIDLPPDAANATLLRVPASALLFRAGGTVLAVAAPDGTVSIRHITILTDLGKELQVDGDLKPGDLVIDSPPDALGNGDHVHIKQEQPNRHA